MRVEVVPYNEAWIQQFHQAASQLREIFADELIDIYHIGSTSVPGLQAKPLIDIMPVVKHIEKIDHLSARMKAIGYEAMGEYGIPGRRYFQKQIGDIRIHNVHVFEIGDSNIERHLAFRDYMRFHNEEAAMYGSLKAALANQFPNDIESYMDGKDAFIKEMEEKALSWSQKKQ